MQLGDAKVNRIAHELTAPKVNFEMSSNKYVAGIPASCRATVERALTGSGSPRQAIKAKCLACSNWQREEIADCTVLICPLHPWRPFQVKG